MTMCKYCDDDNLPEFFGRAGDDGLRQSLALNGDWLELWESGPEQTGVTNLARVNFCPVCGKPLVPGIDHVSMAAMK